MVYTCAICRRMAEVILELEPMENGGYMAVLYVGDVKAILRAERKKESA